MPLFSAPILFASTLYTFCLNRAQKGRAGTLSPIQRDRSLRIFLILSINRANPGVTCCQITHAAACAKNIHEWRKLMRLNLFTPWITIDSRRKPTPAPTILCPLCPEEDTTRALLIDPGIGDECAIYRCERDAEHVMAYPKYLDWPSYRANRWLIRQKAMIHVFFTCTFPWHLRRTWIKMVDTTFLMLYQFAHVCAHWSICTMQCNHEGNIIGYTLLSRGIAALQAILFSVTMPYMEKQARRRGGV